MHRRLSTVGMWPVISILFILACSVVIDREITPTPKEPDGGAEIDDTIGSPDIITPTLDPKFPLDPMQPAPPTGTIPDESNGSLEMDVIDSDAVLYSLQPGSPAWISNFTRPEEGCNWMGVAGQVFDVEGEPLRPMILEVGGELVEKRISQLTLAGTASGYGPGGFEFTLAARPIASQNTLWIQVLDMQGKQVSDKIFFDTYADCDRNLVVINFIKLDLTELTNRFYLPSIIHNDPDMTPTP